MGIYLMNMKIRNGNFSFICLFKESLFHMAKNPSLFLLLNSIVNYLGLLGYKTR